MPWLMKAEPDSRIVKGKDVKFSVDDFEQIGISPWDGVRNHEAKNIMKDQMRLGDKVLFYHSNCKVPGVFAIAEVAKEGYPDHTAFASDHPYYDPKSVESKPTWYMVSVRFIARLPTPVTLAEVKNLCTQSSPPKEVGYIGKEGLAAIKAMALVNRGRLSVQPVTQQAYDAIVAIGFKGGVNGSTTTATGPQGETKSTVAASVVEAGTSDEIKTANAIVKTGKRGRPRKVITEESVGSTSASNSKSSKKRPAPDLKISKSVSKAKPAPKGVAESSAAKVEAGAGVREGADVDGGEGPVAKRGRGRPKKILTAAEEAKRAERAANPPKRGRPRKSVG